MKDYTIYLFTTLLILFFSCSTPPERISTGFDHGSMGDLEEVKPGYYKGSTRHWIKRDSIGDQYYWFYLKADHVSGQTLTFELNDLIGVYRGDPHLVYTDYTQPVYSYDLKNWLRIEDTEYDSAAHTFYFTQRFDREPVWIAYAHPFPYSRLNELLSRIQDNTYVSLDSLAQSVDGRVVSMVTITDPAAEDESKKNILLMALQHAGEDAGGFMAEGMIDFLLSDDPEASEAKEKFIFNIIPMMNPDGIYHGISRYNLEMEDLNNIWTDNSRAQPPVTGVKNWVVKQYEAGNRIDLFIDIHNHTQFYTYNVFIFQDHTLDSLVTVMDKYWPTRIWHSGFEGSSCAWFLENNIPSGTIELSQSRIDNGDYLTIDDYFSYGEGTVRALLEYYY